MLTEEERNTEFCMAVSRYIRDGDTTPRDQTALQMARELNPERVDLYQSAAHDLAAIFSGCLGMRNGVLMALPGHPVEHLLRELEAAEHPIVSEIADILLWAQTQEEVRPYLYIPGGNDDR
jgi:hypothetical protein